MIKRFARVICIITALTLAFSPDIGISAYGATTSDQIKQVEKEQQNTKKQLGQAQSTINQLKDSKEAIQNSLNNLNDQLEEKNEEMSDIEDQISAKKQEIEDIEKDYEDTLQQADEQYKFIKARIKTIYESGSDDFYDLIFNSGSMAGFLNKAIYISRMNEYDEKMMSKLKTLMDNARAKKEQLVDEDLKLQELYDEKEEEVDNLEDLVDSTENSLVSYAGAISEKEKEALEYEAKLVASQSTLSSLKSKLAEEEALARQAEKMAFRDLSEVSVGSGDRALLAAIIQCEAGGEPYAGKIAVGAVIMNRVRSAAFPNTIAGVVYQPMQFQPVRSGRLAIRLSEGANSECYKAADEVLGGANNIGNCLFFRTVVPGIKGTIIGHHVFYLHWTGVASGYGTVEDSLGEGSSEDSKKDDDNKKSKEKDEDEDEDDKDDDDEKEEDEEDDDEEEEDEADEDDDIDDEDEDDEDEEDDEESVEDEDNEDDDDDDDDE